MSRVRQVIGTGQRGKRPHQIIRRWGLVFPAEQLLDGYNRHNDPAAEAHVVRCCLSNQATWPYSKRCRQGGRSVP
jgi:hypothetical protein